MVKMHGHDLCCNVERTIRISHAHNIFKIQGQTGNKKHFFHGPELYYRLFGRRGFARTSLANAYRNAHLHYSREKSRQLFDTLRRLDWLLTLQYLFFHEQGLFSFGKNLAKTLRASPRPNLKSTNLLIPKMQNVSFP